MSFELFSITFPISVIVFFCTVATLTDIQGRVIPDWVCYGSLLAGLGFHASMLVLSWEVGSTPQVFFLAEGIQEGMAGSIACLTVFLPFWFLGKIGGGDVKFVAALGMIVGPILGLKIILVSCLLGASFAGGLRLVRWLRTAVSAGSLHVPMDSNSSVAFELPMAGFFSLAALIVLLQTFFSRWG